MIKGAVIVICIFKTGACIDSDSSCLRNGVRVVMIGHYYFYGKREKERKYLMLEPSRYTLSCSTHRNCKEGTNWIEGQFFESELMTMVRIWNVFIGNERCTILPCEDLSSSGHTHTIFIATWQLLDLTLLHYINACVLTASVHECTVYVHHTEMPIPSVTAARSWLV